MPTLSTIQSNDVFEPTSRVAINSNFTALNNAVTQKTFVTIGTSTGADYVCTGTNDDVQIQAAINAINTAGGGAVFIKKGTYNLTTGLVLGASFVSIIGEAVGSVILNWAGGNNATIITAQTVNNFKLENLYYQKSAAQTGITGVKTGDTNVSGGNSYQVIFSNLKFSNLATGVDTGDGLAGSGMYDGSFKNVEFNGCTTAVIVVELMNEFRNCWFRSNTTGLHLKEQGSGGNTNAILHSCIFSLNATSVKFQGNTHGIRAFGTWFERATAFHFLQVDTANKTTHILSLNGCEISIDQTINAGAVIWNLPYWNGEITVVGSRINDKNTTGSFAGTLSSGALITYSGSRYFDGNGTAYHLHTIATPASAPIDTNLNNSNISFYLDEAGNNLKVRVKYSNGTLKTATIALT